MSGTVKLIGDRDIHWDDEWGYEDHAIATRLIGREDIYWDVDGTDELGSFVDRTGTERPITLINASHIPLPTAAREACEGAENVSEGMKKIAEMAKSAITHSSMAKDTTIEFVVASGVSGLQEEIDKIPKDLGGHTLSVTFPAGDVGIVFQEFPILQGFFNGTVEIDLNGSRISDIANIGKLIHILDCSCKVGVKGGTLKHTYSPYAIQAERCPHVYMTNMIFHGSGSEGSFAFYGIDSDGYSSNCVYTNDGAYLLSCLSASDAMAKANSAANSAVSTHNSDNNTTAHTALFAAKAPLASPAFTGTPTVPDITDASDNSGQAANSKFVQAAATRAVNAHNLDDNTTAHAALFAAKEDAGSVSAHDSAADAHATLFAGKAAADHTHTAADVGADASGTADSAVNTHNSAAGAHATLLASIMPPGTILPYAGTGSAPAAFLLCDGSAVSRETYSELFAVIGETYGNGDGVTTFNVPDFRGAFLRGYDDRGSSETAAMGVKQNEGLPNITGEWPFDDTGTHMFPDSSIPGTDSSGSQPQGAYAMSKHDKNDSTFNIDGSGVCPYWMTFDAHRANAIYGSSNHVTPVNYAVQYIIKT